MKNERLYVIHKWFHLFKVQNLSVVLQLIIVVILGELTGWKRQSKFLWFYLCFVCLSNSYMDMFTWWKFIQKYTLYNSLYGLSYSNIKFTNRKKNVSHNHGLLFSVGYENIPSWKTNRGTITTAINTEL